MKASSRIDLRLCAGLAAAMVLIAGAATAQQPSLPGSAPTVPPSGVQAPPAAPLPEPLPAQVTDPSDADITVDAAPARPGDADTLEPGPEVQPGDAPPTEGPGAETAGEPAAGTPVALPRFGGTGEAAEPQVPQRSFEDKRVAVLQGLDKITARTSTFEVPVGGIGRFGLMQVTVRACRKTPPIETPEAAAFLEMEERRPDEEAQKLFSGWMFASSPALSALEHPVYDVWVIDCRNESTSAASSDAQ